MALDYGFYNSIDGDRKYDAIQFGRIFDGIITDGVYGTYLKGMQVKASSRPNEVFIQPGRAWFNHTWSYVDADEVFDLSPEEYRPEVILDRIDALVLDINTEQAVRKNSFKLVKGDPASQNPQRPTAKLIKSPTHNQYPLAYIYRKAGTTQIYAEDITNMVGTSECPFVTGVLEGIDLDAWINQWDAEFHSWENATVDSFESWMVRQQEVYTTWYDTIKDQMEGDLSDFEAWFETIKGIIDEETATHLQSEIDALSAMLPAGSHITITTNEQSLYLRNVTVSDVAGHSATAKFDNTGVAVVESFPYIGSLTVTSTNGTPAGTATEVISVPYFGRYNVNLAFWSATVNLNGDSSAAGIVVKVKDHSGAQLTTVTLNASGKGVYTASFPDTYKFEWASGGETTEVSLNVTEETTYSVEIYAGFNWRTWCTLGGVSTYGKNSLSDVFADEVATRRLMTVHASADYLIDRVSHKLSDIDAFCANDTAMKWIGLRDYVCDGLTAISGVWTKFLASSYWERILKDHVPVMTSNIAPYGTAFSDSKYSSSTDAYCAFNNTASSHWESNNKETNAYVGYRFINPVCIKKFKLQALPDSQASNPRVKNFKLQASNDGANYIDLASYVYANGVVGPQEFSVDNNDYYFYYRIYISDSYNNLYIYVYALQFYGRSLNVSVPVMTSNTAPFGTASDYKVFDNSSSTTGTSATDFSYKFTNPICVKKFTSNVSDGTLQGSNDGSTWTSISTPTNNTTYYMYYRVHYSAAKTPHTIQFYGVDYSEREFAPGSTMKYLYDHGYEPTALTPYTIGTDSRVERQTNPECLFVYVSATKSRSAAFYMDADVTNYSLMRGYIGDRLYCSGGSSIACGGMGLLSTLPSHTGTYVATASFQMADGNAPYNYGVDISSTNGSYKVAFPFTNNNASSTARERYISMTEVWLE